MHLLRVIKEALIPDLVASYVRELENKLARAERLVRELSDPNNRVSRSVRESQQAKEKQRANVGPNLDQASPWSPFANVPQVCALGKLPETDERDNKDFVAVYDAREGVTYCDEGGSPRLFGESGIFTFSRAFGNDIRLGDDFPTRRHEFWATPACLLPILNGPRTYLEFPEPSLMRHLLNTYFDIHNIILPVLHRPSFERSFANKLYERNESFGTVALLACAIACRYSDDPRVKHSNATSTSNTGWNLFNQVDRLRRTRLVGHELYDVQVYAVCIATFQAIYACAHEDAIKASYLLPRCNVSSAYTVDDGWHRPTGDARLGVHVHTFTARKSLENELWKRSFWVLFVIDHSFSDALGRPCAVQQDDFDVDLPLACDDEYLEYPDPEKAFKQPAGVPSQMDYFISTIRLIQILDFALRTLYSAKKSRTILGYAGKRRESHILSSLETAMEKWADSVPQHLRWDARKDQTNMTLLRQALALACTYHELQIIVYHQFIGRPDHTLSGPALTVCNEAVINCVDAFASVKDRVKKNIRCYVYLKPLFMCAIFLVLQFYGEKSIDRESEGYKAIETIREILVENGPTWLAAVRLTDFLDAILIVSDSQYEGWRPEKDDLVEFQTGLVCFVDRHGNRSMGGPHSPEEKEKEPDSYGSTSLEITPSPPSILLVECSISTGPSSSLHYQHDERPNVGCGSMNLGILPETATEPPGLSFTVPQPTTILPASSLGLDPDLGYGQLPRLESSSVLPAESMVYNDLIMDIGTTQYFGTGAQNLQFAYPTISTNGDGGDFDSSSNWYQWGGIPQSVVVHGPPSIFGYHQPGPQHCGVNQSSAEQTGAGFGS